MKMKWNRTKWNEMKLKLMNWSEWLEMSRNGNRWIAKSGPKPLLFFQRIYVINYLLIFCWHMKSGSRHSVVHTLSTTFTDRGAQPRKQTFQRRPRMATLPEKPPGFAPANVSKRELMRSRSLPLPNYLMIMWLTWWVRQLAMRIVPNSEVS